MEGGHGVAAGQGGLRFTHLGQGLVAADGEESVQRWV